MSIKYALIALDPGGHWNIFFLYGSGIIYLIPKWIILMIMMVKNNKRINSLRPMTVDNSQNISTQRRIRYNTF